MTAGAEHAVAPAAAAAAVTDTESTATRSTRRSVSTSTIASTSAYASAKRKASSIFGSSKATKLPPPRRGKKSKNSQALVDPVGAGASIETPQLGHRASKRKAEQAIRGDISGAGGDNEDDDGADSTVDGELIHGPLDGDPVAQHILDRLADGVRDIEEITLASNLSDLDPIDLDRDVVCACQYPTDDGYRQTIDIVNMSELISGSVNHPSPGAVIENSEVHQDVSNMVEQYSAPGFEFIRQDNAPYGVVVKFPIIQGYRNFEERNRQRWNIRIKQLLDFKNANGGSFEVPTPKTDPAYSQLYRWIKHQRCFYKLFQDGKPASITQARIDELKKIGFQFDPLQSAWESMFAELVRYKEEHDGSLAVPTPKVNPAYSQLYTWTKSQRSFCKKFREGKPTFITQARIDELKRIGFEFDPVYETVWESMIAELVRYKGEHDGNLAVPKDDPVHGKLYRWMVTQRGYYKLFQEGKSTYITQARINELERIGFTWSGEFGDKKSAKHQSAWESMFAELERYKGEHEGSLAVPKADHTYIKLYRWMQMQRKLYKLFQEGKPANGYTQARIDELERIGFTWSGRFL